MSLSDRRVVVVALATCLVAVAVPSGAVAYRRYRTALERAKLAHFLQDPLAPDEGWHEDPEEAAERLGAEKVDGLRESDDPVRRAIASRVMWGNPTADVAERYAEIAHRESVRWAPLMPGAVGEGGKPAPGNAPRSLVTAPSWVNVGPTSAAFEWNAVTYPGVDSGRVSGILVNPSDAAQVIVALSGGGVWKTFNLGAPTPAWAPMGDSLPNLSIGAIDANPANFDELYVGTGDFVDGIGGQMVKTVTGGVVWSAPIQLTGTYPGGGPVKAQRVLTVKVDPANPNVVLVGTDVGLFRSVDAGASYALVDLPNSAGTARLEKVWSLAYTGQVGGVSRWAASGMAACDATSRPPEVFFAVASGTGCPNGNQGDIWISTDAGATWSSRIAAGKLPATTAGRITMAAGTPSTASPPVTVLYAQVSSEDETTGGDPMGFWRSVDSGVTWTAMGGSLSNPTRDPPGQDTPDCPDVNNLGVGQGAYNHALVVDPGDNNRVFVGGMLCAMRITNATGATPTFENVTHWLPFVSPYGDVAAGTLSYAHADHHRALLVRFGATVRALLATDGGLYYSDTLFAAGSPTNANVVFRGVNTGLVTHLVFGMGSGDPATGAPNRVVIGLQDNGTRLRDFASAPTTFNQVIGGDGYGAAYGRDPTSGAEVYWAAVNGEHEYCIPSAANSQCNTGGSFNTKDPSITCTGAPQPDTIPFKNVYAPVLPATAPNTFLTSSDHGVFRIAGPPSASNWQSIVTSVVDVLNGSSVGTNCMPSFVRFVAASQTTDGVYGIALSGGRYAVTSGCTGTTCTWTRSLVVGLDLNNSGAIDPDERTSFTSSLAFPPGPTPGHPAGDVFVVATTAPVTQDGKTLVPDRLGHIFITNNRGASFLALHGNGTGQDLPNVPVNVVRYDTADTTNNTIFVGTLIGVYRTTDGGNTWQRYGSGLPLASINEMFIGKNGGIVRVGTYGRGVWELYPNAGAERGVSGNGDFDANTQIDFIDLAALAIRLGTNPAGSSAPFYDWTVDLTGTANAVDDSDLTALLAKFGDHP